MKISLKSVLVVCACLGCVACANQSKNSQSALDDAVKQLTQAEGSQECAQQSYQAAKDMLEKAKAAAQAGDLEKAKLLALTAKKLAEEAQREAETNREDCLKRKQALSQLTTSSEEIIDENAAEQTNQYDFQTLYFDFDEYQIPSKSMESLRHDIDILKSHPNVKVILAGHTDDRGTTEYNLALSQKRAEVTKNTLVSSGIASDRLKVVPYGKEKLAAFGNREQDHALNRRVEFVED